MAGTSMGNIKAKMGLKGKTKPGEMIGRMNDIKSGKLKMKSIKRKSAVKHKYSSDPYSPANYGKSMKGSTSNGVGVGGQAPVSSPGSLTPKGKPIVQANQSAPSFDPKNLSFNSSKASMPSSKTSDSTAMKRKKSMKKSKKK